MKIGFTGSQTGGTPQQLDTLQYLLSGLKKFSEAHHGDCIGADAQFHMICAHLGVDIVIHPPTNKSKRAFCEDFLECRPAKGYLERNHDIVDDSELMIAVPPTMEEILRSGTWATIRYARKTKTYLVIIFPDGRVQIESAPLKT
jgi:hypothetical protein